MAAPIDPQLQDSGIAISEMQALMGFHIPRPGERGGHFRAVDERALNHPAEVVSIHAARKEILVKWQGRTYCLRTDGHSTHIAQAVFSGAALYTGGEAAFGGKAISADEKHFPCLGHAVLYFDNQFCRNWLRIKDALTNQKGAA